MPADSANGGEARRHAMTNADAIKTPADAISLLDVCVSGERDWSSALARQSLFRVPDFKSQYDGLSEALINAEDNGFDEQADIDTQFRKEASRVAGKLIANRKPGTQPWSEANYGRGQLDYALHGKAMRFDKAVISVLAFNRFAKQHDQLDHFALDNHSVVVCGFFFSNLYRFIETFGATSEAEGDTPFARGVAEIASITGQAADVIEALAGNRAENLQTGTKEKAITHLGSFPAQFAILEVLAPRIKELKDALDEARERASDGTSPSSEKRLTWKIERHIVRRRQGMSPPKTMSDEVIEPFGRVTWGLFGWGQDPENPDRVWPAL